MAVTRPRHLCLLALAAVVPGPTAAFGQSHLLPHVGALHGHGAVTAVTLSTGGGRVLTLSGPATNVFVADPKVAEVRPASPNTLFVFGLAPGRTTVAALAADGHPLGQYDVSVFPSDFTASEAQAAVLREMPGLDVKIHPQPGGLTATGQVETPEQQARVIDIVDGFLSSGQTLRNEIGVTAATQVTLQVRIAEMSRTVARQLGVNWSAVAAIGSSTLAFAALNPLSATANNLSTLSYGSPNANVVIDALAQDSLAKILAEPNLTVMSGQPASFFVGGEFPIPVGQQNNTVTIEFKRYGVSLDFVPTVLSSGRINLHVRPEVSELTNTGAVQLGSGNSTFSVPALLVRRAETTVELGSGQSFAIAGLLQDSDTNTGSGTPVLGDVPVLGALFRSNSLNRSETELVILITPYIVRPVNDPSALTVPGGDTPSPNDIGRVLLLRQMGQAPTTVGMRVPGQAGFMVQ
ncbi:MAG: type II and III secretion system protein family protein [Proteobacteria bacterium]|nr:type II and III secretion system protein family protein [Pseudomonadota bacterium]